MTVKGNAFRIPLRPLPHAELTLGRELPGHLRDATGRILIRAGERLSPESWELLDVGGDRPYFVGPDWPPADALQATETRTPRRASAPRGRDSRRHRRHRWKVALELELLEAIVGLRSRKLTVTSTDISLSGFSFVAPFFVHSGTVVHTQLEALQGRRMLKAVVRYCVHHRGRQHRVGVEFIRPDQDENVLSS